MNNNPLTQEIYTKPLKWPTLDLNKGDWWSKVSFLFGIVIVIFPELLDFIKLEFNKIFIGLFLLITPLLVPVAIWTHKVFILVYHRTKYFSHLFYLANQFFQHNFQLKQNIMDLITQQNTELCYFEISRVIYTDRKIFAILLRRGEVNIKENDLFAFFSTEDRFLLGVFQVSEVRSTEIYSIGVNIDPLWSGYIRDKGEITTTPFLRAVSLNVKEPNNE